MIGVVVVVLAVAVGVVFVFVVVMVVVVVVFVLQCYKLQVLKNLFHNKINKNDSKKKK